MQSSPAGPILYLPGLALGSEVCIQSCESELSLPGSGTKATAGAKVYSAAPAVGSKGMFHAASAKLISFWKYSLFRLLIALCRHEF